MSTADRHTHRTSGQVLTHSHPGGDREHQYFEHHEDGCHITCDHGPQVSMPERTDWAGQGFSGLPAAPDPAPWGGQCCDGAPHFCPGCQRVMSHREAAEQDACNDCHDGRF